MFSFIKLKCLIFTFLSPNGPVGPIPGGKAEPTATAIVGYSPVPDAD